MKNFKTASGKHATHRCIIDGEAVCIVNNQAPGRGEGFVVVEGATGKFIAHEKRDLTLIVVEVPDTRPQREYRDRDNSW